MASDAAHGLKVDPSSELPSSESCMQLQLLPLTQFNFGTPYNAILTPPLSNVESQAQGGTAGFLLSSNNQTCAHQSLPWLCMLHGTPVPGRCRAQKPAGGGRGLCCGCQRSRCLLPTCRKL